MKPESEWIYLHVRLVRDRNLGVVKCRWWTGGYLEVEGHPKRYGPSAVYSVQEAEEPAPKPQRGMTFQVEGEAAIPYEVTNIMADGGVQFAPQNSLTEWGLIEWQQRTIEHVAQDDIPF